MLYAITHGLSVAEVIENNNGETIQMLNKRSTGDALNEELAGAAFELARDYCKRQRVSLEWLAEYLGYNATTFSNYLHDNRPLPGSLISRMTQRCGISLIMSLCRQAGGVFMPTAKRAQFGSGTAAYREALRFVETSGGTAKVAFKALEDGKLTQAEHNDVMKWLSKQAEAITLLRHAFEEMPISACDDDGDDAEQEA